MNNKNRLFRVTSLLLVLCFVSTVMISGTFAKYTSEYAGADTALIAKWDLDVTDGSTKFATSPATAANLDLFSHLYTGNMVTNAGTMKIIAPGVSDSFILSVKNNSDVAADVKFAFTVDGSAVNVPIEYSLTNDFSTKYETVGALATALNELDKFETLAAAMNDPTTQTVYWRWSYTPTFADQTDAKDTALGTQSVTDDRSTYILNVTATATQLAPTP